MINHKLRSPHPPTPFNEAVTISCWCHFFSTLWETFPSKTAGYHTIKEVPRRTCQKHHVSRLSKTCSIQIISANHCNQLPFLEKSHGFSAPRASSTKTSIFFLGASIAAPRKAALGPRKPPTTSPEQLGGATVEQQGAEICTHHGLTLVTQLAHNATGAIT